MQLILATPSGVFLMPCVFLAPPVKENSRSVQHIIATPSGVFLKPYVFLALFGKETADLHNTFLQQSPVFLALCFPCTAW
jgi:hypothetical protein